MAPIPAPLSYVCDTIPAARLATGTGSSEQQHMQLQGLQHLTHRSQGHRELGVGDRQDLGMEVDTTTIFEPAAVLDDVAFASDSPSPKGHHGHEHEHGHERDAESADTDLEASGSQQGGPPPRKLCVRHQRMADEGTNLKLQQSLDALPLEERQAVNAVWSNFSSSSHPRRALILQGLLTMCCFSQLSLLTEQLAHLIRIDPFTVFPRETCLKILGYLDATSLCRASQVTKRWKCLADDNILWMGICEQHIGQKCLGCGWGLPVLEKKRGPPVSPLPTIKVEEMLASTAISAVTAGKRREVQSSTAASTSAPRTKRCAPDPCLDAPSPPLKRQRSDDPSTQVASSSSLLALDPSRGPTTSVTRPWKDVYSERMTVERNWRRGRCTVRTLKGHTDGVMCLQFSETLAHPAFPVLISGSYDRTVRVWNLETGAELHCMKGHTRAVRALQFDEVKLITGSMDCTLKVWDWRRGRCIRTLTGHTEGVVCLNFDENVLASGSVDSTIKVWNLRTGGAFTLRGHSDWVNAVQLWDSNAGSARSEAETSAPIFDVSSASGSRSPLGSSANASSQIDPGKMLFSASDDGTIKLWDLNTRTCVRQFLGHVGQVQSMKLLMAGECDDEEGDERDEGEDASSALPSSSTSSSAAESTPISAKTSRSASLERGGNLLTPKRKKPVLISGSLDNTIKLWDIETGKATRTYFGHIEGVWGVASDKMRLVSASHDRTIKVWAREEGSCTATLVGHQAAVSCLALGEDKIVSGSDDQTIKIWSFSG